MKVNRRKTPIQIIEEGYNWIVLIVSLGFVWLAIKEIIGG